MQGSADKRMLRKSRILPLVKHINSLEKTRTLTGAVVIDTGCGWDLISSIIFSLLGAKKIIACDHVAHVRYDLVSQVIQFLIEDIEEISDLTGIEVSILASRLENMQRCVTLQDLLIRAKIDYCAPSELHSLPVANDSVDIVYSYAVLAHPPRALLKSYAQESKRVLRESGIASHYIGLQDPFCHLYRPYSNIYFLKHSETFWNFLVSNSINSNNRLRATEHIAIIVEAGGRITSAVGNISHRDTRNVAKLSVAGRFKHMSAEDLSIYRVVLLVSFDGRLMSCATELNWVD